MAPTTEIGFFLNATQTLFGLVVVLDLLWRDAAAKRYYWKCREKYWFEKWLESINRETKKEDR